MRRNPTSPVVITDTNGKVTTVHRRVGPAEVLTTPLPPPPSTVNSRSRLQEVTWVYEELKDRAKDLNKGVIGVYAKKAYENEDLSTLRALQDFATGERPVGNIVEAVKLLRSSGARPEEWLNEGNIDAMCNVREELGKWEMSHDISKSGEPADTRMNNRRDVVMFVLEDPSRESLLMHALRNLDIGEIDEIKKLDFDAPTALVEGVL